MAENPPASDFCGKCGAPLTNGAGAAAATSSPPGLAPGVRIAPEQSVADSAALEGKRDDSRAMLAEIYGWFTEGFDTADLKDAKALLQQFKD